MRAVTTIALWLAATPAFAQAQFPEPDWEVSAGGDTEIFSPGVTRVVGFSGPVFVMVDASYSATAPDNGNRRNTQGTLQVSINGVPCGWDSYGNEIHTSTAAVHVHCFVRGTGQMTINAIGWLRHCCEGGDAKWDKFKNRASVVNIYAWRAEAPAKDEGDGAAIPEAALNGEPAATKNPEAR